MFFVASKNCISVMRSLFVTGKKVFFINYSCNEMIDVKIISALSTIWIVIFLIKYSERLICNFLNQTNMIIQPNFKLHFDEKDIGANKTSMNTGINNIKCIFKYFQRYDFLWIQALFTKHTFFRCVITMLCRKLLPIIPRDVTQISA